MRTINREEILAKAGHVLVLMGGQSSEREISLKSGKAVSASLQRLGIEFSAIDVGDDVVVRLQQTQPDLVLNMLHGKGGEDGIMQGLLEAMGLKYSGSGVLASALAMDKVRSKQLWVHAGLNTAEYRVLNDGSDWQGIIASLGKVVVKPVSGGSSLGIAITDDAGQLRQMYQAARAFDTQIMAERYIAGREFSTGVLGEDLLPTIQLETERQFFDFEAKYVDKATRIICPAELEAEKLQELETLVRQSYDCLGCRGLARVDVMQSEAGEFFLLELNTIPGMTEHSFVPTSAHRIGIDFDELVLRILDCELNR
ncbi:MAG: D-alanine--D-alanine ligase [Pseudomonadales bacterium]|nr:D-alanine--D-alanine ligase [Pseudomonadales bacterium]